MAVYTISDFFSLAISFVGRKFVVGGDAQVPDVEQLKPWRKYLIPNVKTDRLKYFNSITEDLYKCAYTKKQSLFQAYLEGQRKFRWNIKIGLEHIQNTFDSYHSGMVPQENINLERYQSIAIDVKVQDVGKCQRALTDHVNKTLLSARDVKARLLNRKKELVDASMAPKDWAHDELNFIGNSVEQLTTLIKEIETLGNNLQFVLSELKKRFDTVSVLHAEKKRSARRQKEQRSKVAKKKRMKANIKAVAHDQILENDLDSDTD